jgi:hypothetical protein
MFSYIEKPLTLVDIIADEVVVISDGVDNDNINQENNTLFYQLLTYRTYLGDSLVVRIVFSMPLIGLKGRNSQQTLNQIVN